MITKERKKNILFSHECTHRLFVIITLLIYALPLVGVWTGLASDPGGTSDAANGRHSSIPTPVRLKPISLSPTQQDAIAAESLALKYMNALLGQDYQQMWSLLHPQMQAKWPGEAAFASFWKARYQDYTLYAYTTGPVKSLSYWIDPETMVQYNQVEKLSVSLELRPKLVLASLPPEDLHPSQVMANLPFVVQHVISRPSHRDTWFVLDGGPADPEAPILPPMTPVNRSIPVPILMYHHITDVPPLPGFALWSVTIEHFTQQMDYLQTSGYHTITFNQLMNALYYGGPLPSKPVILTFDDGDEDAYQNAYPILLKHHFSGMFYIVSGWVGLQDRVTWSQLREMLAHGMQIGSHTVHHPNLNYPLLYSVNQAQQEFQEAQQVLEQNLGIVIQHFCYPYGEPFYLGGVIQRQRAVTLLPADGYVDATVAVGVVSGIMQTASSPFTLPRVPVFGYELISQFINSLAW